MKVFLNPKKIVPTKINESIVKFISVLILINIFDTEKIEEQGWTVWYTRPEMDPVEALSKKGEAILSCKVNSICRTNHLNVLVDIVMNGLLTPNMISSLKKVAISEKKSPFAFFQILYVLL